MDVEWGIEGQVRRKNVWVDYDIRSYQRVSRRMTRGIMNILEVMAMRCDLCKSSVYQTSPLFFLGASQLLSSHTFVPQFYLILTCNKNRRQPPPPSYIHTYTHTYSLSLSSGVLVHQRYRRVLITKPNAPNVFSVSPLQAPVPELKLIYQDRPPPTATSYPSPPRRPNPHQKELFVDHDCLLYSPRTRTRTPNSNSNSNPIHHSDSYSSLIHHLLLHGTPFIVHSHTLPNPHFHRSRTPPHHQQQQQKTSKRNEDVKPTQNHLHSVRPRAFTRLLASRQCRRSGVLFRPAWR